MFKLLVLSALLAISLAAPAPEPAPAPAPAPHLSSILAYHAPQVVYHSAPLIPAPILDPAPAAISSHYTAIYGVKAVPVQQTHIALTHPKLVYSPYAVHSLHSW